ncbi:sulfite exporter TauE/SafE family protein [Vibrio harveyi]|uniref:sulfite exporter TauE/SafE family protein n=1 Tax=Vibrio harveyi TaxID=669 RepID=UPI000681E0D7|nr:sulfite exporter TauE/SafE family protein [Vibrio harveyi]AWB00508.1 sulfite exporter TauE/SafE family protein [Vibrio harveyi]EKO3806983.1 sulfite exporter TauE/SafE family protein [Vibrio harveyi]EKO3815281.1 sulfite exporter TauE/SafE family protein [Vibrio harveyi]EKO3820056.1 sulfite exporter TauE/SafE family protein [Vibrio harveyi]EKO3825914.1 sulfite exporter TauE/SafE family protein [Vibrio harveyi]
MSPDFIGAFMIGLVGAGHCMGMCGGIASLLSMGAPNNKPSSSLPLFYNVGRLASYALIGAIVGGAISGLSELSGLTQSLAWLRFVAALFMILVALYIAKWWQGLLVIEKAGQHIWKFISPVGKRLLPLKHPVYAFPFGFIWGWLPCGLVYSALTWSAVSGDALNGGLIMLSFGLGTLPSMLAIGYGASHFQKLQKSLIFRNISALILISYGMYTAAGAMRMLGFI